MVYNLLGVLCDPISRCEDLTSGFRVMRRRDALRFIDLLPNTFSYPTTLTLAFLRSGLTVKYVPIQTLYRAGQSKISLVTDGIRFLLIITKIATLFSPFRVFLAGECVFLSRRRWQLHLHLRHAESLHQHVGVRLDHGGDYFHVGLDLRTDRAPAHGAPGERAAPGRWVNSPIACYPQPKTQDPPDVAALRDFYDRVYYADASGDGGKFPRTTGGWPRNFNPGKTSVCST